MSINRSFAVVMLVWAGMNWPVAEASESDTLVERHAQAIAMAREGELDASLELIEALRAEDPENLQLIYDEIVVLQWADRDDSAVALAAEIDSEIAPDYVLRAVAKSWRNLGELETSANWYQLALTQSESDVDARIGLANVYADAGRFFDARQVLRDHPDPENHVVRLNLAEAYVLERQGRVTEALGRYQRVLEHEPENPLALRATFLLLRSLLLPREALALARQHPGTARDDEIVQLEADVAALRIRFGAQSSYPAPQRFAGTDRALSDIDALLARNDLDPAVRQRLGYDRIVALTDRLLSAEAIEEFEAAQAPIDETPVYVLSAIGRSYSNERQPELARYYLETALDRDPGNLEIQFRLFYVYADLQEHELALNLAQRLLESLPPVRQVPGSTVVQGSEEYLRAAIMVGLARAYADQLAESQQHFEKILAALPHNTDIRQELANVYRWRGWIDRSLSEYAQVLAVEPGLVSARLGNAHTQLDNRDYVSVEQELEYLEENYPLEPAIAGLEKRWNDHNRYELFIDSSVGRSSGSTFGEDQYRIDATWYTKPIAYNYRAFVSTHDAYAEFPEGEGRRERIGAGVEYRQKRWLATAELAGDRSGGGVGLRGSLDYRLSDFFKVGGKLETHSDSMPLRGERAGISSDLLGLNAAYTPNESTAIEAGLTFQDFSDGNASRSLYVSGRQRVVNRPEYKLELLGDIYTGSSDNDSVPYFSPLKSSSWSVGASNNWLMYRRYDFGLSHNLTGRIGQVDQSGFAADSTWSLEYRFYADFNSRWQTYLGVSRNSNVYDGGREYATYVSAGLRGLF